MKSAAGACSVSSGWDVGSLLSSGNLHVSLGCQNHRNTVVATNDPMPPTMFTSAGPYRWAMVNGAAAQVPPQTRIAGQHPLTPFQPAIIAASHAGMIREKNVNCRPAI